MRKEPPAARLGRAHVGAGGPQCGRVAPERAVDVRREDIFVQLLEPRGRVRGVGEEVRTELLGEPRAHAGGDGMRVCMLRMRRAVEATHEMETLDGGERRAAEVRLEALARGGGKPVELVEELRGEGGAAGAGRAWGIALAVDASRFSGFVVRDLAVVALD